MSESVRFLLDGREVEAPREVSVAAALLARGVLRFRTSLDGSPRGPLCGMGICFECRVTIDGRPHRRSCQVTCGEVREVRTT